MTKNISVPELGNAAGVAGECKGENKLWDEIKDAYMSLCEESIEKPSETFHYLAPKEGNDHKELSEIQMDNDLLGQEIKKHLEKQEAITLDEIHNIKKQLTGRGLSNNILPKLLKGLNLVEVEGADFIKTYKVAK